MRTQTRTDRRIALSSLIALPVILAIAIPLYFSGTPGLRANPSATGEAAPLQAAQDAPTDGTGILTPEPAGAADPEPTGPAATFEPAAMAAIDALLAEREGVYGLVLANPATGARYSRNADVPFLAASLYKLVLLADVYAAIDGGMIAADAELTLEPDYFPGPDEPVDSYYDVTSAGSVVPISDALYATGAYSSNVAAYALLALTDDAQLETMARRLGMNHTFFHVQPDEMEAWPPADSGDADPAELAEAVAFAEEQALDGPLMLTTARDVEIYFAGLLSGEVVNPGVSALILQILKEQAVDDRFPCLLPAETEMAHKTGNLDHVVHDVGIIWTAEGPVILVAMVEDPPDDAEATLVIQRLAAIAYGLDPVPTIADAFATPEISCGIVAPLESETTDVVTEEAPVEESVDGATDLVEGETDAVETDAELSDTDPAAAGELVEAEPTEDPTV